MRENLEPGELVFFKYVVTLSTRTCVDAHPRTFHHVPKGTPCLILRPRRTKLNHSGMEVLIRGRKHVLQHESINIWTTEYKNLENVETLDENR